MVLVYSHPSASSAVMDESSFYHSLHELKLQLDRMNQRTATLLRHHSHSASVSFPPTSERRSSWLSHSPSDHHNYYQPVTNYRPEPGRETREAQLDAYQMKLLELQSEALRRQNEPREREILTPPSSPGSTVHEAIVPKPAAELSEVGYLDPHFDAHKSQIQREFHHLYTSNPMTFVSRLRRVSRTKSIPSFDRFLRGPALRWYNIGLCRDGSHAYDVNGEFQLDAFCDSLLDVFGCTDGAYGVIIDNGRISLLNPEKPSLVEDYAFPALERAQYQSFSSADTLIDRVHETVLENARSDNVQVPVVPFDRTDVAEYLKCLRHFEYGCKYTAKFFAQPKEDALPQEQERPGTVQPPAEATKTKVTPKASKDDVDPPKNEPRPQHHTRQSIFNHEDFMRGISSPSDPISKHPKPERHQPPIYADFEKERCEQKTVPMPLWADAIDNNEKVPISWSPYRTDSRRKDRRTLSPLQNRRPLGVDMGRDSTASRHEHYDEWRSRRGNLDTETRSGHRGHSGRPRWENRDESPYARVPHHARSFEDSYSYMRPTHAYAESVSSDTY